MRSHTPHNQKRVVALVGNKLDLLDELAPSSTKSSFVAKADAETFASENDLVFFETSAKSGENVQELFESIGIVGHS